MSITLCQQLIGRKENYEDDLHSKNIYGFFKEQKYYCL